MRHLLLVAMLLDSAHAETRVGVRWGESTDSSAPALIRVGTADKVVVDRVTVALRTEPTHVRATLRLRVSTRESAALDVRVLLELTRGTELVAMSYSVGGEAPLRATFAFADRAVERYEQVVAFKSDPALLQWRSRGETIDTHELAVYPVSRGMPATVTIEMLLPEATQLVLDAGAKRQQLAVAAPREGWALPQGLSVDESSSLYADDQESAEEVAVALARRDQVLPRVRSWDRRFGLRALIRSRASQLRHCYELGVLLDPHLSPSAELAIELDGEGSVKRVTVTGEMHRHDIRSCIADEVGRWEFAAGAPTRIRQAIDLHDLE
jgi:hypothetical protein